MSEQLGTSVSTACGSVFVEDFIASLPPHLQRFTIEDNPRGCWIAHNRAKNGYAASSSVKGHKGSRYRLIWEHLNGLVPTGMVLDHYVCDNGPGGCCNPFHLKVTTQKENVLRSPKQRCAINARKTHCIRGHELTPDNILKQSEKAGGGRNCRTCQMESNKRHRERVGKEEWNRKRREDYARNREQKLAQKRAWRAANPEKVAELRRREREKRRSA